MFSRFARFNVEKRLKHKNSLLFTLCFGTLGAIELNISAECYWWDSRFCLVLMLFPVYFLWPLFCPQNYIFLILSWERPSLGDPGALNKGHIEMLPNPLNLKCLEVSSVFWVYNHALLSNQQLCNSDPIKQLNWIKMIFFAAWMVLFWERLIVLNSSSLY